MLGDALAALDQLDADFSELAAIVITACDIGEPESESESEEIALDDVRQTVLATGSDWQG